MIVINLTTKVNTDAELKALTGMADQDFVYHVGDSSAYIFRNNVASGDLQSDDLTGWWIKDDIECLDLDGFKQYRIKQINDRTSELIAEGYSYNGMTFPLSQNGQINLLGMFNAKDFLTYPVDLNNIDDTARYKIQDATDVTNIYLTALSTKKIKLDSGTALKDQIANAVDENAVAAIIDNR